MSDFLKKIEIFTYKISLQMGYTDRREVRQFQYTAWPDHGVPDYPGRFFFILTYIFAFHKKKFKD